MALLRLSSDSDDSDLEMLAQLSDWDTDSDADENIRRRAASRTSKRINFMLSLDDAEFTFRFRLSKHAVNSLLTQLMPFVRVTSARNHGVSPLHQLLLTLRFYALGTMLISVADFVGVSISTAGRIVLDISSAIANLYDEYIIVHQQSAGNFYQIGGFPRVLAAIDCTHIRIQSPSQCDAGQFGNRWMLGDSAYPNRPYLLTPLLNPVTVAEQHYNEAHIKTRNIIERTFGVWKRRFPVVALTMRLSLPKVQAIIIATAVLHNICRDLNMEEVPAEVELPTADNIENVENMDIQDVRERAALISNYFS